MKNTVFTGAGVAIVTPFHNDGSINYNKLEQSDTFYADQEEYKKESGLAETWAEDAQDDLEDWIEGQGIQLRY